MGAASGAGGCRGVWVGAGRGHAALGASPWTFPSSVEGTGTGSGGDPPLPMPKPTPRRRARGRALMQPGLARCGETGRGGERRNVVLILSEGERSSSGIRRLQPLPFPPLNELQAEGAASHPIPPHPTPSRPRAAAAPGAPSPTHALHLLLTSAPRLGLGACTFLAKPGPKISGGGRSALGEGDELLGCARKGGCGAAPLPAGCRPRWGPREFSGNKSRPASSVVWPGVGGA